jgi:hypothetical protein
MNGRTLTDDQISQALRALLPDRARTGLRERILESTETTVQQRALPSFLGTVTDADPVTRRRSLLLAAALLIAVALASAAAVGAWRQLQRDEYPDLSLEPPTDIPAFVISTHDRMTQLPPVAITTLKSDATKDRIYVDRSGAVRLERYTSADATEPVTSMVLSGTRFGRTMIVGTNTVWVEQDEAIGDDPRVWIYHLTGLYSGGGSGCEMTRDPSEAGNGTAATGWRYVGADSVAGRPAHHLACAGNEVWIDDETRLILRIRDQDVDDAGNPIPGGAVRTTEVTMIEFGEQPASMFAFAPPNGVTAMPMEAYLDLCPGDKAPFLEGPPCAGTPRPAEVAPTPAPTPSPTPTTRPNPSDCAVPSPGPGEPSGPLAWTQASLRRDWPAPIRPEPAGGASVLPMPPTYIDPLGDTGSDGLACVDIRDLTVGTYDVSLDMVANRPPDVDPSKAWIAYGVVVDEDRDGVPDWRYGIDNLPRTAGDEQGHHREWRTDLHTGRTEWAADSDWDKVSKSFLDTGYPAEGDREGFRTGRDGARFRFGHVSDTTGGTVTRGVKVAMPLYAWASVIVDGRVVATDYAPDAGWLLPSPRAKPGGTYVLPGVARGGLPFRLSMRVPDGWTISGNVVGPDRETFNGVGLDFMIVDKLDEWGCEASGDNHDGQAEAIEAKIGPGVDDLVTFLAGQKMLKISENTDVTLDGYRGRYLEYTATISDDNCHPPTWPLSTNQNDNREFNQAWIIDVDGARLVIDGFAPKASETVKAEFQQIVDSIDIGP